MESGTHLVDPSAAISTPIPSVIILCSQRDIMLPIATLCQDNQQMLTIRTSQNNDVLLLVTIQYSLPTELLHATVAGCMD